MKIPIKSNCLLGAIIIKAQLGGKIEWRSGWKKAGWRGLVANPWGHFTVRTDDAIWSYSALDKDISAWGQLWFKGYLKKREIFK